MLTTGGRSEKAARRLLPDLPEVCFVEVGDFTGYALKRARSLQMERCVFVGMVGKLSKLGAGVLMTHWTRSRIDTEFLAGLTAQAGGDESVQAEVRDANSARHAYELWVGGGPDRGRPTCCASESPRTSAPTSTGRSRSTRVMVDFEGASVVGTSAGARRWATPGALP